MRTLSRYSVVTHGIRVQLLLQSLPTSSKHIVFVAYLACRFADVDSSGIIGIYLMFKRPGQYLRLNPDVLLLIEEHKSDLSTLTLEDVYVSNPLPEIKDLPYILGFFVKTVAIMVIDDEFPASCFRVHASSEFSWDPEEGRVYISLRNRSPAVGFQHLSTGETFTIDVGPLPGSGFAASIRADIDKDSEYDSIVSKVVDMPLKTGRHVFVSFSHESNDDTAVVMVIVKGKWRARSEQSQSQEVL
jgi:hypothetical protein